MHIRNSNIQKTQPPHTEEKKTWVDDLINFKRHNKDLTKKGRTLERSVENLEFKLCSRVYSLTLALTSIHINKQVQVVVVTNVVLYICIYVYIL